MLTQKLVKHLFEYRDGQLVWKNPTNRSIPVVAVAGTWDHTGYFRTTVAGKKYKNSRLIFLYHCGYLPECVDHIDGSKTNDRIENLRPATKSQNNRNVKLRADNVTGAKGVTWDKCAAKWRVSVWSQGKQKTVGRYADIELAELVAIEARNKYHKEFANHG
jgi:hypothetical protein